jgi:putative component of membrane protein insertase Oxa1/YidC/SpoIIIJ protein YidD
MQAFKKYGVVKGAILTAWRLSRYNPLGTRTLTTFYIPLHSPLILFQ